MLSGEMVTLGAPRLPGTACALGEGVEVGCGASVGLGVAVSSGVAVGNADALGLGVGDLFFPLRFVPGVGLGDGVGEIFFFGEAVGDGLGVDFLAARFRCFRAGVGVGVASRNLFTFVPNDSSALPEGTIDPKQIAVIKKLRRNILVVEDKFSARFPGESPYSGEYRHLSFRAENSRSVSARGNQAARVPSAATRCPGCRGIAKRSGCCRLRE